MTGPWWPQVAAMVGPGRRATAYSRALADYLPMVLSKKKHKGLNEPYGPAPGPVHWRGRRQAFFPFPFRETPSRLYYSTRGAVSTTAATRVAAVKTGCFDDWAKGHDRPGRYKYAHFLKLGPRRGR